VKEGMANSRQRAICEGGEGEFETNGHLMKEGRGNLRQRAICEEGEGGI